MERTWLIARTIPIPENIIIGQYQQHSMIDHMIKTIAQQHDTQNTYQLITEKRSRYCDKG